MYKSDSHDSGVEYNSQTERLVKDSAAAQARRARRLHRNNPTTAGVDEAKSEAPETRLKSPTSRQLRRSPAKDPSAPSLDDSTTVTVENETKPRRKKKTFKAREGEDIEMAVKKPNDGRQQKRRTKSKESPARTDTRIDPNRDKILGIFIHRTDRLRTDLRLRHPLVRVHIIDMATRSYIHKTTPNRPVFQYHHEPEQPLDYIPAISTQPYDFNENRSTIPSWESKLIINEDYTHFTSTQPQNIYFFFEILEYIQTSQYQSSQISTFPIAWAFLKLLGARNNLNTERMMRLQLWEPMYQQRSGTATIPDVVVWFNELDRVKYPSTIYVTLKSLGSQGHFRTGIHSAVTDDIDGMRKEYAQLMQETKDSNIVGLSTDPLDAQNTDRGHPIIGPLERVAQRAPRWHKLPNSKCKIPVEPLLSLQTSERGCSSIRFSHNGYFLACAEVNKLQQNNIISIIEVPTDQRVTIFPGHLQMIYDLDWSKSDWYLASASADSSVKIWDFKQSQRKPWKTLPHPTYVYCVRFHPITEKFIITAGYDKIIRIWNLERKHGHVIHTLSDHLGYISSLSFNPDGTRFASVDNLGAIKIWNGLSNEFSNTKLSGDAWSSHINFDFEELKNIPLNSVQYSPGDNLLLVSARDNKIVLVDVRTRSISKRYLGIYNLQERIRSTFSTCGSYIFSGSEDGLVHCWNAYDGNIVFSYKDLNYTQPVVDIQFHPFENMLAMCAIGTLHQVYVFQHTYFDADMDAKPIPRTFAARPTYQPTTTPGTSMIFSDSERPPPTTPKGQSDRHARGRTVSDTDHSIGKGRTESSGDETPTKPSTRSEARNRRLAVVNKILDEMDDVINAKNKPDRGYDPISGYGGGYVMSRSTERDVSPFQKRRNPPSGYISDSGRPPMVSPLRNLTSPDLFVPASNKMDDDDNSTHRTPSSQPQQIMYATTNYTAQSAEELSFLKNDKIKILNRESHLLWYAEHTPTGTRGYISPNRVHVSARDGFSHVPKSNLSSVDTYSISEVPRLDNNSRRIQQKSVKFDSSD